MRSICIRRGVATIALICAQASFAQTEDFALTQLHAESFSSLDRYFEAKQAGFEAGTLSEFELRKAYVPLYDLNAEDLARLKAWAAGQPRSYAAHLLLGIHYKRRGDAARGTAYIAKTDPAALREMDRQFALASTELARSAKLTAKPYMTWFFLISISTSRGSADETRAILDKAVQQYPPSELVRLRYMGSLTPRWGGSYEQMDAFIARSRAEGMPRRVIAELTAVEEDDKGDMGAASGDERAAVLHFEKALALAKEADPYVLEQGLSATKYALCNGPRPAANCR
jgi:hypothetical protein